jgi:hypothetical protein
MGGIQKFDIEGGKQLWKLLNSNTDNLYDGNLNRTTKKDQATRSTSGSDWSEREALEVLLKTKKKRSSDGNKRRNR